MLQRSTNQINIKLFGSRRRVRSIFSSSISVLFVAWLLLAFFVSIGLCTNCSELCMNGSTCNESTGQCECIDGWTGPDCNDLACGHGHLDEETNICICDEGWYGVQCLECQNDTSCINSPGGTNNSFCDTTMVTYDQKQFHCTITDPGLRNVLGDLFSFQCVGIDPHDPTKNGTCTMQLWTKYGQYYPGMQESLMFCNFYDCNLQFQNGDNGQEIAYNCPRTRCNCTGRAANCGGNSTNGQFVERLAAMMVHAAHVTCDAKTNLCKMTQEDLKNFIIPFQCSTGQCLNKYVPPPPPPPDKRKLYEAIAFICGGVLLGGVALVIIASIVLSKYHAHKANKQYRQRLREERSGVKLGSSISFANVSYYLPVREFGVLKRKKILDNVSHTIKAGQVVAIMGASGAGKTTLLDILANRNKQGKVEGNILVDGKPRTKSFKRLSGYVFQEDALMGTLTVKESVMFSANLRLPSCISQEEKKQRVAEVLEELGISEIADRQIGSMLSRGISGGEKRRVSIAMELVISPNILFLDEPTSGLDAYNAYCVMESLVKLAKKGRTIIFSIHQPRSNIFKQFDQLILISHGRIAYAGPAKYAVPHFQKLGYRFPSDTNPADFLIDIVTSDHNEFHDQCNRTLLLKGKELTPRSKQSASAPPINFSCDDEILEETEETDVENRLSTTSTTSVYDYHHTTAVVHTETTSLLVQGSRTPKVTARNSNANLEPFATSFYSQFMTLSGRAFKNFYRNFFLMPAHFGSAIVGGVILGLIYWKLGINLSAIQNRIGSLFFMCALLGFGAMSSLELFISERAIYMRERANGYYKPSAYFFSKVVFDLIPLRVFPPLILGGIAYWMIGLHPSWINFGWFLLILTLFNLASGTMCMAVGSVVPSVASGNLLASLLILFFMLFCGFLLNKDTIPVYLGWIKYLSFWNYAFEALLVNELHDVDIIIDPQGIPPIPGKGDFVLLNLGMDAKRFYVDIVVLCAIVIGYLGIAAILIKFFVKEKR